MAKHWYSIWLKRCYFGTTALSPVVWLCLRSEQVTCTTCYSGRCSLKSSLCSRVHTVFLFTSSIPKTNNIIFNTNGKHYSNICAIKALLSFILNKQCIYKNSSSTSGDDKKERLKTTSNKQQLEQEQHQSCKLCRNYTLVSVMRNHVTSNGKDVSDIILKAFQPKWELTHL